MTRKVIVHIAASADGFIARKDGNLDWLTSRPHPPGFYGMAEWVKTIDLEIMGRKTYEEGLRLGGTFDKKDRTMVFSRSPRPANASPNVQFVNEPVRSLVDRLRSKPGKNIWLMGGGELIADFLDANAIDEFFIGIVPVFIGEGIPLIAPRHRHVQLKLVSAEPFEDGLVMVHYEVAR
jgi:dihydrofolate reductase